MLKYIREKRSFKVVACFLAINILSQMISPSIAFALTSGPGQQEYTSFEPASTSDMVDLYTGDFTYNIPLMSVPGPNGGYPINLAYHSAIGMDQEASWVGFGWSLNAGAITRQLRGIPDDFSGNNITHTMNLKSSVTVGLDYPNPMTYNEVFGVQSVSADPDALGFNAFGIQIYYNNYTGLGFRLSQQLPRTFDRNAGPPFLHIFLKKKAHNLLAFLRKFAH